MEVYQVLNNNVVTSIENNKEIVIIGTGVGFGKKKGSMIDQNKIQNRFYPANHTVTQQLISLMEETPEEVINIVSDIVKYTENRLKMKLDSGIYITLTDHISFSIERYKKGLNIKNILLWDIKRLYQKEFECGLAAIELIEQRLSIKFPEDEAAFIAYHILNAEYDTTADEMEKMTTIINDILKIRFCCKVLNKE